MSLLDRIFKDMFEHKAGKIHFSSGGWAFNPPEWLIKKTIGRNPNFYKALGGKPYVRQDANGEVMTLVSQRSVICPNSNVGHRKYPRHDSPPDQFKRYCVPANVCRKCEFHKQAEPRGEYRFPRCMYRATQNPIDDAATQTLGILNDAVSEANKLMGRG